jgi:hypothetical protein
LIHTGNTDEHTAGCLLVGNSSDLKGFDWQLKQLLTSASHPAIAKALESGKEVTIEYIDWNK